MEIRLVEVEIFNFCNRTCSFCPNSFIDRLSEFKPMSEGIFLKLIDNLAERNYNKVISFSRYNEPFSYRDLLEKRIAQIRERLDVKLVTNTNGDYDYSGIDIDEITVMDYDGKWSDDECGVEEVDGRIVRKMKLKEVNVGNRAGALVQIKKKYVRDFPCYEPTHFVGVDYTGDIVPCCNIRHDVEKHKPFVLGNLRDNTLWEVLESDKATSFRNAVANMEFPSVCLGCDKGPGRYTADDPNVQRSF